jgi:hypothetical protein
MFAPVARIVRRPAITSFDPVEGFGIPFAAVLMAADCTKRS